jgi:hypothetical protein
MATWSSASRRRSRTWTRSRRTEAEAVLPQDIAEIVAIAKQVRDSGKMPESGAIGLDPHGVSDLNDAFAAEKFTMGDGQVAGDRDRPGLSPDVGGGRPGAETEIRRRGP